MKKRFLGRTVFLRHGQTKYTDVFPDLTKAGTRTITKSAGLIRPFIKDHQNLVIVASPHARTLGSADVIAKAIEYKGQIKEEPTIRAAGVKDKKAGKAIFDEHTRNGGMRALSIAYATDPRYEDSQIFEPRSEVRQRFFVYLAHMVRNLLISMGPTPCFICVSHYETLYYFVERLFGLDYEKDEPLGHGEIIVVSIYDVGTANIVELEVTFRNETINNVFFDYKEKGIRT